MSGEWKEVAKLTFKGKRFEGNALDIDALGELVQFQAMIAETAKVAWRAEHPERKYLPAHFDERTRLCLRRIEPGSAVAPMEVYIEEPEEEELFEPEPADEVMKAVDTACKVYRALDREELLPENFPRSLIPTYTKLGQSLKGDDESIEIIKTGHDPARITTQTRTRWTVFTEAKYEDAVDIEGEVLEADIKKHNFQIWKDERTCITVAFTTEQEDLVTEALKEHRTRKLQVKGRGEFIPPQGILERIKKVEDMRLLPVGEPEYDASARPIQEILMELAKEVPEEEWEKIPSDSSYNLDHYLYGSPKK